LHPIYFQRNPDTISFIMQKINRRIKTGDASPVYDELIKSIAYVFEFWNVPTQKPQVLDQWLLYLPQ